jgi:uncharacterized protein YcbK (DUF882 family)
VTLPDGRHFKAIEFSCHDAARTPYPEEFLDRWIALRDLCDAIRDLWGGPLLVVSGYRTPDYNADLIALDAGKGSHGVASSSQHIEGRAADLRTKLGAVDVPQLLRVILNAHQDGKLPTLGGVGDYHASGWVHVDTLKATDGHLRRWRGV